MNKEKIKKEEILNELYGKLELEKEMLKGLEKREKDLQLKVKNHEFAIKLTKQIIKDIEKEINKLEED